ncbi:MAG: tRNA pseudouridine(38-40) synthase TruA [Burkholderiaceae bacterium]|nr:tRNA pseudouridine(38-40) synthase TruA [Rhodoferax sp.]MCB2005236.1 tRNA pseudouridine(38-40) synthase TruA [Rhodoferax sp.]MCP5261679.1 tRNA pseudouridine(38-40) synthase TruA [Rhodoferax sp.]MCW5629347.1 tRNA pseudouridine(38-40) synthase TruA [Rhodoferax sp.]MCW5642935.1 tRNA pseudouridine(38-40) synthase TruA [Rhodoferax sp.]
MRVALGISYDGRAYQGWQSQLSGLTVQDRLESALSQLAAQPITTVCAGRTDAGVHALMQVVHFDTSAQRRDVSWVRGTNTHLPRDISVEWAQAVPDAFHCRAHALTRRYAYVLYVSPVRPSVYAGRVGWVMHALDIERMRAGAARLIGEHDFSSFRAAQCQALSPVKDMRSITIDRRGAFVRFEFEASAFLHHMIRNIMGCLIAVGGGKRPPEWIDTVLHARERRSAAPTFAPDGLYFLGPRYDPRWGLPERTAAYDGLP